MTTALLSIAIILDIANENQFFSKKLRMPSTFKPYFAQHHPLTKFQSTFRDKEPPIMSYEYTSTVASNLFNFASTLSNLNDSDYLSNPQTYQCKESRFCYEPQSHVITGDLKVIDNAKLMEHVAKEPKYREPNRLNWKAILPPVTSLSKVDPIDFQGNPTDFQRTPLEPHSFY